MILLDSGIDNIYFRYLKSLCGWLFFFSRKKIKWIDTEQGKNAL